MAPYYVGLDVDGRFAPLSSYQPAGLPERRNPTNTQPSSPRRIEMSLRLHGGGGIA